MPYPFETGTVSNIEATEKMLGFPRTDVNPGFWQMITLLRVNPPFINQIRVHSTPIQIKNQILRDITR
jgi:hypothetical protein